MNDVSMKSVPAVVRDLKEKGEDFEWYPTTTRMLDRICNHHRESLGRYSDGIGSVLDIGAGNGSALRHLVDNINPERSHRSVKGYAIEKSLVLTGMIDPRFFIVGSDAMQQSLFDKGVDMIFCNPPYSEFLDWMYKVLVESPAQHNYMIVPRRWREASDLHAVIEERKIKVEVIDSFDFLDADRAARAKVDILYLPIHRDKLNSFEAYIKREFKSLAEAESLPSDEELDKQVRDEIVVASSGVDFVTDLVAAYNREMSNLEANYAGIKKLDARLLLQLGVSCETVAASLAGKIEKLKMSYWRTLFDNMKKITNKLTAKNREAMLQTLFENAHVNFSVDNIAMIVNWVIANSNQYLVSQLLEVFDDMADKANVIAYKSNEKVFGEGAKDKNTNNMSGWRFREDWREGRIGKGKLDFRLVIQNMGGIHQGYGYPRVKCGLCDRGFCFVSDIITAACNLGFSCAQQVADFEWTSGKKCEFFTDSGEILFDAKAFKNGNIHIRLSKKLALSLNVEYGRLKGWVLDAQEAADELQEDIKDVAPVFGSMLTLKSGMLLLGGG